MMRISRLRRAGVCLWVLGLPSVARGQAVAVAQVSGMVTDQSGSAVAATQILITQTDKQLQRATVSDSVGRYVLPNLPVGPYKLEAKAAGFKDYVQPGILLQVG